MQTSSFITLLNQEFPDWSRTKLLTFLHEVHRMVFTQEPTAQMMIYDSTTGNDHLLSTTAGDYDYDLTTVQGFSHNVWRATEVYASDIDEPEDVVCYDATPGVNAKVVFRNDPSTSTYYVRAYRFPADITAESIQLEVPHAYHISHLYEGVAGLVEKFRSGKSERWDNFNKALLPELIKKMSDGRRRSFDVIPKGY